MSCKGRRLRCQVACGGKERRRFTAGDPSAARTSLAYFLNSFPNRPPAPSGSRRDPVRASRAGRAPAPSLRGNPHCLHQRAQRGVDRRAQAWSPAVPGEALRNVDVDRHFEAGARAGTAQGRRGAPAPTSGVRQGGLRLRDAGQKPVCRSPRDSGHQRSGLHHQARRTAGGPALRGRLRRAQPAACHAAGRAERCVSTRGSRQAHAPATASASAALRRAGATTLVV